MRNWAGMLPEMLYLMCKHVGSFKDLVSFGGVCSTWRHVAVEQNLGQPLLPFPWLMLAENYYKIPLPHLNTSECYETEAMDPLEFVSRAVLSSPPNPQNERECLLMILHGEMGQIGFCRPGDKKWNVVQNNFESGIESLEYFREKLYVVANNGEVWEFDLIGKSNDSDTVSSRKIELNISPYLKGTQSYLVQSTDSLLVVTRNAAYRVNCISTEFWVLEIDVEHGGYKVVSSLGTKAIFLGHSASLCVETTKYPGLISNSIYFTDDCTMAYLDESSEGAGMNMGVYLLEDKSVKPHYSGKSLSRVCPPVWTF